VEAIVGALAEQHAELDALLVGLDAEGWARPSPCDGWDAGLTSMIAQVVHGFEAPGGNPLAGLFPAVDRRARLPQRQLARAREAARRSSCANNLKQIVTSMKMYANEAPDQKFPPDKHKAFKNGSCTPGAVTFGVIWQGETLFPE
jgi:hypothetical protein